MLSDTQVRLLERVRDRKGAGCNVGTLISTLQAGGVQTERDVSNITFSYGNTTTTVAFSNATTPPMSKLAPSLSKIAQGILSDIGNFPDYVHEKTTEPVPAPYGVG